MKRAICTACLVLSGCATERIELLRCEESVEDQTRTISIYGQSDTSEVPYRVRRCEVRNIDTGCTAIYVGSIPRTRGSEDEQITVRRATEWDCRE